MQQSHFGTGYSSLNYLREFPFDAIKLDRTFISGIAHVARDLSIVRSIVSLGKAFGYKCSYSVFSKLMINALLYLMLYRTSFSHFYLMCILFFLYI
ncbi:EAL domain-containing protein [Klebsiella pneumoniae]